MHLTRFKDKWLVTSEIIEKSDEPETKLELFEKQFQLRFWFVAFDYMLSASNFAQGLLWLRTTESFFLTPGELNKNVWGDSTI
jgi:hypothetical protein